MFSNTLLCLSIFIYEIKNDIAFYVAVGLTTFAYGIAIPSINTLNSIVAKHYSSILRKSIGLVVTVLTIFQAPARFLGPTLFTLSIHPNENDDDYAGGCDFSLSQYNTTTCVLRHYESMVPLYNCVGCVIMLYSIYMIKKRTEERMVVVLDDLEEDGRDTPILNKATSDGQLDVPNDLQYGSHNDDTHQTIRESWLCDHVRKHLPEN